MLFINFLTSFYVLMLVNGQTISKSIDNFDDFNDLETIDDFNKKLNEKYEINNDINTVTKVVEGPKIESRLRDNSKLKRSKFWKKVDKDKRKIPYTNTIQTTTAKSLISKPNINLIKKPTAIVKLHSKNKPRNKCKIFKKFHFRKDKKNKKEKREQRLPRFDALKILKDIFKVQNDDEVTTEKFDFLMTQADESSKPLKYRVPNVEEMVKEIPVISNERMVASSTKLYDFNQFLMQDKLSNELLMRGKQKLDKNQAFTEAESSQDAKDTNFYKTTPDRSFNIYYANNKKSMQPEGIKIERVDNIDTTRELFNMFYTTGKHKSGNHKEFTIYKDYTNMKPITSLNPTPLQYFQTPVPMKNSDFHKFLKNHHLNVDTITTPLPELPDSVEWKIKNTPVIKANIDRPCVNKLENKLLRDTIKQDAKLNTIKYPKNVSYTIAFRRDPNKLMYRKESLYLKEKHKLDKRNEYDLIRDAKSLNKKLNFDFLNRKTTDKELFVFNQLTTKDSEKDNDVEITIIDMDASTKTPNEHNSELTILETKDKNILPALDPSFSTSFYSFLHNSNLYNQVNKEKHKTAKVTTKKTLSTMKSRTEKTTEAIPESSFTIVNYNGLPNGEQKKVIERPGHKRLHISGHSYKCDIIYHDPKYAPETMNFDDNVDVTLNNADLDESERDIKTANHLPHVYNLQSRTPLIYNFNKIASTFNEKPKREVKNNKFTAKDVAALEVVVDLMKTPQPIVGDESNSLRYITAQEKGGTNAIQVHIAVPYDFNDKKRSLNPVKVRKVFSAVLSTPVDLEYQVKSFEDTTPVISNDNLSPGMYLLVENPKGNFALVPVTESKVKHVTERNIDKVTLHKDFAAAINKHLAQLYDNFTKLSETKTKRDVNDGTYAPINRRHIDWDAVKKFFGHDRVCNCRCRANRTMCRACAASDAVISELMFEFNNLAQYMSDHCTEIQTYFWMNPNGGRKLKDTVHNIDKSLNDYYKRVKGKCQGRTCKTFSYIDKRNFILNDRNIDNFTNENLIEDMNSIVKDLGNAAKLNIYDEMLIKCGREFIKSFNNCINNDGFDKIRKQKNVKNVYALDNISVNIICNSESTDSYYRNIDSSTKTQVKSIKRKGLRKFFHLRNKNKHTTTTLAFAYDFNKSYKREANYDQIESPLNTDSGGSFWYDYLKGNTDNSIVTRDSTLQENSFNNNGCTKNLESKLVNHEILQPIQTFTSNLSKPEVTIINEEKTNSNDDANIDSLGNNINALFKLLNNLNEDITVSVNKRSGNTNSMTSSTKPTTITTTAKLKTDNTQEDQSTKKPTHKRRWHKIIAINDDNTKLTIKNTVNKKSSTEPTTEITKEHKSNTLTPIFTTNLRLKSNINNETTTKVKETTETTTKEVITTNSESIFCRIKSATLQYMDKIGKYFNKTQKVPERYVRDTKANDLEIVTLPINIEVENVTEPRRTSKLNPTIIIIDDMAAQNDDINRREAINDKRELLFSLLNYESDKNNEEWINIVNKYNEGESRRQTGKEKGLHSMKPISATTETQTKVTQKLVKATKNPMEKAKNTTESDSIIIKLINKLMKKYNQKL